MSEYRTRRVDALLARLMTDVPAVMIVGPRAAGKSTTAARLATTVVQLDRAAQAAAFLADPDAALAAMPPPVLLDEWQEVPGVLGAVKRAVDADGSPGRYLLAGLVRADLRATTWPGTGRVIRVRMYPLTVAEQMGRSPCPLIDRLVAGEPLAPAPDPPDLRGYVELALVGGFPEATLGVPERARRLWLESYIEQILTHDAPTGEGGHRRDPHRLGRYLLAYAINSAGVAEDRTIYTAAGIDRRTAVAYEALLGDLMVAASLPAWTTNRLKRLIRSPKRHLVDTGLWAAAMGVDATAVILDGDLLGRLLDTFVTAQLRTEATVADNSHRLFHLRTEQGRHEIDLVAEIGAHRVVGIEIKASAAPTAHDARHLLWLRDQLGDRFSAGVVLHTGPATYRLADSITAAPICTLWS